MAEYGANLELIPIYLDERSKDDLIRLMYLNNQTNQIKYNYMSAPVKEGSRWVVWFYADIKTWQDPRELDEKDIEMMREFGR